MRIRGIRARRAMLGAGVLLAALGAAVAPNAFASDTRTLSLYEIHTKERLTVTYKRDGEFDDEALEKLNYFMRDWRANEPTKMDRELIDLAGLVSPEIIPIIRDESAIEQFLDQRRRHLDVHTVGVVAQDLRVSLRRGVGKEDTIADAT